MELQQAISQLDQLEEDAIICAKRPWSATAECRVTPPDENLAVPAAVKAAGYDYFLEVHVAKEVVEGSGERHPTLSEQVRLLIFYAKNDAYP